MDPTVTAAIIGGTATVFAAVAPIVLRNLRFEPLSSRRKNQINGQWRGVTNQAEGPDGHPIVVDLVTKITVRWRTVRTETRVRGGGAELMSHSKGGFITDEYLKVDYKSVDPAKLNFGTTILKLSGDGTRLVGRMLGYGMMSEKLVHGEIVFTKIAT